MSFIVEGGNGNLLETIGALGSLMGSFQNIGGEGSKKSTKEEGDSINILEMLGTVVGGLQNAGGGEGGGIDAGSLLQGLGGLLSGGQNGQGGIDSSMMGSLVNAFMQKEDTESSKIPEQPKTKTKTGKKSKTKKVATEKASDENFDLGEFWTLAQSLLGNTKGRYFFKNIH